MEKLRRKVINNLWLVVLVLAFCMLLAHSLDYKALTVDSNSIILLPIVLASPFIAALRKVKFGEFEAEIAPSEVAAVKEQAENSIPINITAFSPRPKIEETLDAIQNLSESDPVLALAKLRIEFEMRLRRLCSRIFPDDKVLPRSIMQMLKKLVAAEIFERDFGDSFQRVISITNRAIHGEDIREIDAKTIVSIGSDLLNSLDIIVQDHTISHPTHSRTISSDELHEYQSAKYRLITITPYVENPKMNTYELSQEEMDNLLDGYPEYAEFLVSLEKIA